MGIVGRWIRDQRTKNGWSQDDLAFRAHVAVRLIGRYERGEGEPNNKNLGKIMRALGYEPPWHSSELPTPDKLARAIRGMADETFDLTAVGG